MMPPRIVQVLLPAIRAHLKIIAINAPAHLTLTVLIQLVRALLKRQELRALAVIATITIIPLPVAMFLPLLAAHRIIVHTVHVLMVQPPEAVAAVCNVVHRHPAAHRIIVHTVHVLMVQPPEAVASICNVVHRHPPILVPVNIAVLTFAIQVAMSMLLPPVIPLPTHAIRVLYMQPTPAPAMA
jgi:hypothetical protein